MDLNESTIPVSVSDSRSASPFPVTETVDTAPASVEEEMKPEDSLVKRKRGRPRKYDSNGKLLKPSQTSEESSFSTRAKRPLLKRRGTNPFMRLGGGDFTPYIITINTGEDIIERIMSFPQNRSRGMCVLSANGAVFNVKIQPLGFDNKVLTFQGAYEIVSLSGSMVITESGGVRNVTEAWRISIAGVNGCFFGGSLVGRLIAASPVQVVIGSFCPLIANTSMKRSYESNSLVVTPTIPGPLAITLTGQVQQPELRDPSHMNQEDDMGENTPGENTP